MLILYFCITGSDLGKIFSKIIVNFDDEKLMTNWNNAIFKILLIFDAVYMLLINWYWQCKDNLKDNCEDKGS